MSNYLNTNVLLENYKNLYRSKYFIDKSLIIDSLNQLLNTSDKYVCMYNKTKKVWKIFNSKYDWSLLFKSRKVKRNF